jgi:hypothetical protein
MDLIHIFSVTIYIHVVTILRWHVWVTLIIKLISCYKKMPRYLRFWLIVKPVFDVDCLLFSLLTSHNFLSSESSFLFSLIVCVLICFCFKYEFELFMRTLFGSTHILDIKIDQKWCIETHSKGYHIVL